MEFLEGIGHDDDDGMMMVQREVARVVGEVDWAG